VHHDYGANLGKRRLQGLQALNFDFDLDPEDNHTCSKNACNLAFNCALLENKLHFFFIRTHL